LISSLQSNIDNTDRMFKFNQCVYEWNTALVSLNNIGFYSYS